MREVSSRERGGGRPSVRGDSEACGKRGGAGGGPVSGRDAFALLCTGLIIEFGAVRRLVITKTARNLDLNMDLKVAEWMQSFPDMLWMSQDKPTAEDIRARATFAPTLVTRLVDQYLARQREE